MSEGSSYCAKSLTPSDIVPAVYGNEIPRAIIASLAFTEAEASDSVAQTIIPTSARDLAEMVLTVARQLNLTSTPLFFTGALLLSHESYRTSVRDVIAQNRVKVATTQNVESPAMGALQIAKRQQSNSQIRTVEREEGKT